MATITAAAGGGNWNATATWTGAVIPTAADDVVLASTSGAVTIPAAVTALGRSLTTQTGSSLTFAATTSILTIGDASGGAMTLSSGMTLTLTGVGTINFVSTSNNGGVGWSITTAGKTLPNVTFSGATGKWVLADALNCGANTFNHTGGTFDSGSFSITCGPFSNNSTTTRTLTLGSSSITASGSAHSWRTGQLTVTNNTATLTLTSAAVTFAFNLGTLAFDMGGLSVVATGAGQCWMQGNNASATITMKNYTRNGTAVKTETLGFTGANWTFTSTLTLSGNSAANRMLVSGNLPGSTPGVGSVMTLTAAAISLSNVDFMDIAGAGAAAPFTGTSLGDALGNSGITFTTPVTRYGVVAGNWSSTATWSTTSGGAGGASVPLPQDTVILNASSAAGSYFCDMPRLGKDLICTGFTRTFQHNGVTMYGSMTFGSTMSVNFGGGIIFAGRGSHTVTTAGIAMGGGNYTFGAGGTAAGTYTMQDAWSGASTFLMQCTFSTGGFSVTVSFSQINGTATRTIDLSTSVFTLTTGTWQTSSVVGLTLLATSSTIVYSNASATVRAFAGAGFAYGTLTYTVANSPGGLTITGANSFVTLNVGSGRTLTLPSSTTTLVTNWNVVGQNNGYVYLPGGSGNYMSAPDSAAVSITSDIDLRCRVALDSWTTGTSILLAKRSANAVGSYVLYMLAGVPHFIQFVGVAATDSGASIAATTPANGTAMWVRATWRQSDGRIQFFTAPGTLTNPVASDFTQVGTDRTGVTGSMPDTTDLLEIGSQLGGTAGNTAGKFYRAQVRNGLDGTVVFDADLVNKTFGANTFVESSTQAATVTLNGTAPVGDGRVFLNSSTGGTAAILLSDGPQILSAYLKIQDVAAGIVPAWNVSNLLPTDTSTLEGSIGSWVASTGCTIARSTADFRDGAASLLLTPTTTGPKATNDATKIAITLGTLYVVSAYVKAATAGATMAVYPYFWNSTPIYLADGVAVSRTDVTTAWTRIINGFVPSGTQAYASPAVNGVAVVGQAHYYDDIAMAATTPAYAGATSLSVSNTTGWLFTDMAVGAQIGTPWPVRTPVGAQCQGLWPARAVTGQSCQAVWPVRTAVGQQRQGLWPVRTPVASQRQGLWSVRATVASQRQALWPVRVVTSAQRAAVWPVRMLVHGDRQLAWPVRAAMGSQRAAAWPVRTSVGAQRSAPWPVRTVISAQRAAVWPVRAKVGQQRQALWPTRTPVGSQRQALWLLLTNVRSDRQASWPVRSVVGAQRQAVWSARALVTGQRQARWPVRVPVAKQAVIAWPIHSPVTRSLQASWLLTAQVASQRQVAWPLAAVVGKQTDLAWGVRVTVRNTRAAAWPIATRVTAECVLEWTMVISVGRTLAVRWPTRRTVGRDLMSMWSLGHLVACQLALVWRIFFGPHRDVDITVASPELGWTFDSPVLETAVGLPSVETVST